MGPELTGKKGENCKIALLDSEQKLAAARNNMSLVMTPLQCVLSSKHGDDNLSLKVDVTSERDWTTRSNYRYVDEFMRV
jgi:hypothetical protein